MAQFLDARLSLKPLLLADIRNTLLRAVDCCGSDRCNSQTGDNNQGNRSPVRAEEIRQPQTATFQFFDSGILARSCDQLLATNVRLVCERGKHRQHHDDKGQSRNRRRDAIANLLGQFDCQRRVFPEGEGGGVVVLKARQEGQHRRRGNCRFHERQQNLAECLRVGCTQIQCRLCQRDVIPLQTRDQNKHAVAGNKGGLTNDGQEQAIGQEAIRPKPQHPVDPVPEHKGRDTKHDARNENRRNDDRVVGCAQFRPDLSEHQRSGQPHRNRQNHRACTDQNGVPDPVQNAFILKQGREPFKGQTFPRRRPRKLWRVESGDRHDHQRPQQIGEENRQIEPYAQAKEGEALHLPMSPMFTLNRRMIARTSRIQVTSRTTA